MKALMARHRERQAENIVVMAGDSRAAGHVVKPGGRMICRPSAPTYVSA